MNKPEIERMRRVKEMAHDLAITALFNAQTHLSTREPDRIPDRLRSWQEKDIISLSNELQRIALIVDNDFRRPQVQPTT